MIEDVDLLKRYAKDGCAKSFELIVRRHIGWVYSAALRMVRDAALAEDLTQSVFVLLENRAGSLKEGVALSGWLFNTLRFVARESRRKDQRRRKHETRAALHEGAKAPSGVDDAVWEQMSPLLEEAVGTLAEADRQAVLLRFYEGAEFVQIGNKLGITEVTARKRVSRAVKKLGAFFKQKGVIVPAVVLAATLFSRTAQAAPAGLVDSVISATGGNAGAALACSLVKQTAMRFMIGRRRLAAAIVACMGLFGVALWVVLVAWMVRAPEEGEGARTPLTGPTPGAWNQPFVEYTPDEFELPRRSDTAVARYDFGQPTNRPKVEPPKTAIDALWWFREMYDLRNSPTVAQANKKNNSDDPMIEDPRTGEIHPRSWYEENGYPSFDLVATTSGGGGGGGTADSRTAGTLADGATGKSAGGSEHGGGFGGASSDVNLASSSGDGSSTDASVLVAISKTNFTTPVTLTNRSDVSYSGTIIHDQANFSGNDGAIAFVINSNKGYFLIHVHNSSQLRFPSTANTGDNETAEDLFISSGGPGADGSLNFPAGDLPANFDPNDPAVLAEIAAIQKKYGIPADQISLGYSDHGTIIWKQVPEPGVGLIVAAVAMVLGRRRWRLNLA